MKQDTSKSTILVISMGFLALFLYSSWKWAAIVSLITGVTGIVSPFLRMKIEWAWLKLAKLLSFVVPNILLGLLFYLVLFPISLLSKIFRKDPLMLSNKHQTYFIDINKEFDKSSFEKIW